uniref:Peptidase S1 domain-containing protein n=1 Tax=Glossina pallidipes TaxID=7398 RepID=A0A1A9Z6G0_GLOPL
METNTQLLILMASKLDESGSDDCLSDREEFERPSKYWKYIVEVYCQKSGKITFSYGVILSKYIVLTSFKGNALRQSCYIGNRNRSHISVKDGSIVWTTKIPYTNSSAQSSREIQLILVDAEIDLGRAGAKAMRLPTKKIKQPSNCVVVGLALPIKWIAKVVNKKVDIIDPDKCYAMYPQLDRNIICIQIPKEFGTCSQCDEYIEGSALICDDVLTGIVGPTATAKCRADEPRSCADLYESRKWIKLNMDSFSKDSKYKENVVWVEFLLEGKSIGHSLGVIIGKNKILTGGGFDFNANQSVFMAETGRIITEGTIRFDSNFRVHYKNLINLAPDWPLGWSDIHLSVLSVDNNVISPSEIMPLPIHPPKTYENCLVVSKHPTWIKYKVDVLKSSQCREELPNFHKDYICIRLKINGVNHCAQLVGGSPLICSDDLVGIVANYGNGKECIESKPRVCSPVYKYLHFIQAAMWELDARSSHNQLAALSLNFFKLKNLQTRLAVELEIDQGSSASTLGCSRKNSFQNSELLIVGSSPRKNSS